jgi:signal transduction histidine kinase
MLDIRSFVVRAAAYSFTTLVLALLYVGPSMFIFMKVMDLPFKPMAFAASVVLGTIVAMNYQRIRTWFNRATNKIFFRDVYDPTLLMSELNKSLLGSIDTKKLLASAEKIIAKGFNPEYCYFLLTPQEKTRQPRIITSSKLSAEHNWLIKAYDLISSRQRNDILLVEALPNDSDLRKKLLDHEAAISIRLSTSGIKNEVLGYVLLGVRKSGKPYDVLDAQVLGALANTLTIAMQNALHFEEIQKFNATLQEKVDAATRKLRTTNEKLKKLDETKDEFISMASHQLRTPLTSVKGYLSMVLEGDAGPLKPQQEELLKQSYMSSQRMVNLIADLLNLSRLNTGKFVIDAAPTDLRVVVDQEVSQLRESAKSKQIQVNWEMPASFSLLQLDEGKIHQVVMNFIDNALYYTPVGGTVDISLSEVGSAIEFRVKDSGIGVPREMQHKLFGKFFRADNARRMRPDGTGLGLYMAKKVVLAQGGSIIFESREGKGSTFGFRFSKSSLKPHSEQP